MDDVKGHPGRYLDKELADIVRDLLTRALMKKVFLPLVYGKTKLSAKSDILQALDFTLSKGGDGYKVVEALYKYWESLFPEISNLMTFVNEVGSFAGYLFRPVRYHSQYFTTVKDYVRMGKVTTTLYNKKENKTHRSAPYF